MGFNNGGQIQGSFRMEAAGPADLASVTFQIDQSVVATVTAPPFGVNFRTDDYAPGWHSLSAVGQTASGAVLTAQPRRFQFPSSTEARQATQGILIPMFSAIALALLIGVGIQFAAAAWRPRSSLPLGAPRAFGLLGGAVCPKCGRPFPIHWWSMRLVVARFERCDHCGHWGLVRRASPAELAAAEAAEADTALPAPPERGPGERLKRQLDDSRFMDDR
jgi:Zn ribbon nucleic-acid-binding protein